MKRLLYLATAALVASLLLAPAAMAQDDMMMDQNMMMGQGSGSQTLQLTPSRNSGVSGTAVLTETAGGVQVQLNMQGLPQDGVSHLAHIHSGATCADDRAGQGGPVEFPLESVTAMGGMGSSTTLIPNVTLGQLFDGTQRYVNVHAEQMGAGTPPGVACADLTTSMSGGQGQVMDQGQMQPLAGTGGPSLIGLSAIAIALLVSSGLVGAYAIRRRRNIA
jgi:hypothetical protein